MSNFYKGTQRVHIFAIVGTDTEAAEQMVFVGMTQAKTPRRALYPHRTGQIKSTANYFGPDGILTDVKFFVLEILDCNGATAFKHIVAWYRYFEEQGIEGLCFGAMSDMVENLTDETRLIYEDYCKPVPLEDVFTRKVVAPPLPKRSVQKTRASATSDKITIRMSCDTADQFRKFCLHNNVSHNDALLRLLSETTAQHPEGTPPSPIELQRQKELVSQLRRERNEQKKRMAAFHRRALEYRRAIILFANQIVQRTEHRRTAPQEVPLRLEKFDPQKFKHYNYPHGAGCVVAYLDSFVRGKNRALFVLTSAENGSRIKLRYYPRREYVGSPPFDDPYAYRGALWIFGYITSDDGAIDIIASFPLEPLAANAEQRSSIDAIIKDAKVRAASNKS